MAALNRMTKTKKKTDATRTRASSNNINNANNADNTKKPNIMLSVRIFSIVIAMLVASVPHVYANQWINGSISVPLNQYHVIEFEDFGMAVDAPVSLQAEPIPDLNVVYDFNMVVQNLEMPEHVDVQYVLEVNARRIPQGVPQQPMDIIFIGESSASNVHFINDFPHSIGGFGQALSAANIPWRVFAQYCSLFNPDLNNPWFSNTVLLRQRMQQNCYFNTIFGIPGGSGTAEYGLSQLEATPWLWTLYPAPQNTKKVVVLLTDEDSDDYTHGEYGLPMSHNLSKLPFVTNLMLANNITVMHVGVDGGPSYRAGELHDVMPMFWYDGISEYYGPNSVVARTGGMNFMPGLYAAQDAGRSLAETFGNYERYSFEIPLSTTLTPASFESVTAQTVREIVQPRLNSDPALPDDLYTSPNTLITYTLRIQSAVDDMNRDLTRSTAVSLVANNNIIGGTHPLANDANILVFNLADFNGLYETYTVEGLAAQIPASQGVAFSQDVRSIISANLGVPGGFPSDFYTRLWTNYLPSRAYITIRSVTDTGTNYHYDTSVVSVRPTNVNNDVWFDSAYTWDQVIPFIDGTLESSVRIRLDHRPDPARHSFLKAFGDVPDSAGGNPTPLSLVLGVYHLDPYWPTQRDVVWQSAPLAYTMNDGAILDVGALWNAQPWRTNLNSDEGQYYAVAELVDQWGNNPWSNVDYITTNYQASFGVSVEQVRAQCGSDPQVQGFGEPVVIYIYEHPLLGLDTATVTITRPDGTQMIAPLDKHQNLFREQFTFWKNGTYTYDITYTHEGMQANCAGTFEYYIDVDFFISTTKDAYVVPEVVQLNDSTILVPFEICRAVCTEWEIQYTCGYVCTDEQGQKILTGQAGQ